MLERRNRILDAAIAVTGDGGARALTHRAVDARAGLPMGSTSNLFRSRSDLLVGMVERFVEREQIAWREVLDPVRPLSPETLARALADLMVRQATTDRAVTLTRHAILIEAATTSAVRAALRRGGSDVMNRAVALLRDAGSPAPEADAATLAHWITGTILHELADPAPTFHPHAPLAALVRRLIPEE